MGNVCHRMVIDEKVGVHSTNYELRYFTVSKEMFDSILTMLQNGKSDNKKPVHLRLQKKSQRGANR